MVTRTGLFDTFTTLITTKCNTYLLALRHLGWQVDSILLLTDKLEDAPVTVVSICTAKFTYVVI